MIVKKLWTELINQNNFVEGLITSDVITLAEDIDSLYSTKFSITSQLKTYLNYIKTAFFSSEGNNQWTGLNIFISSYSYGDQRFMFKLHDKLIKYLTFYKKFITDDGSAKRISTDRGYTDNAGSTTTDENVHSETPQIELDNFEQGIKYASTMDKNTNTYGGTNSGTAYERKTETSWDEAMTNLRTMLFNELIDYITNIPNMIYNFYATDTLPFTEIILSSCKYFKNLAEVYKQ